MDSPAVIGAESLPPYFAIHSQNAAHPLNERDSLLNALIETNWNKSKAAEKLEWSRMTLYRKLKKYQLESPEAE